MSKTHETFHLAETPTGANMGENGSKVVASHISHKYAGTDFDRRDMSMLGKKQVLRRQFKFSTMLGFASTVMVAWEFILIVSPFSLANGGTPAVFWGLIMSPIVLLPVYASLAEVASMSPTTAGQYHVRIIQEDGGGKDDRPRSAMHFELLLASVWGDMLTRVTSTAVGV